MSRYDFGKKYREQGLIARRLIENFYAGIGELTAISGDVNRAYEVGCGEGYSTERLRGILPANAVLTACDVETRLVEAARTRNPGLTVVEDSIYALQDGDGAYDVVYCMEVLEHLERPDDAIRELCRVSRRHVILSVPREPLWRFLNLVRGTHVASLGNTPGHVQRWSRSTFVDWAGAYGRVAAIRSPLPWTQVLLEVSG